MAASVPSLIAYPRIGLHASLIQPLTGGDKSTARYMFPEFFDFYLKGSSGSTTNPPSRTNLMGCWTA